MKTQLPMLLHVINIKIPTIVEEYRVENTITVQQSFNRAISDNSTLSHGLYELGTRNPVLEVSDEVRFKPAYYMKAVL